MPETCCAAARFALEAVVSGVKDRALALIVAIVNSAVETPARVLSFWLIDMFLLLSLKTAIFLKKGPSRQSTPVALS